MLPPVAIRKGRTHERVNRKTGTTHLLLEKSYEPTVTSCLVLLDRLHCAFDRLRWQGRRRFPRIACVEWFEFACLRDAGERHLRHVSEMRRSRALR